MNKKVKYKLSYAKYMTVKRATSEPGTKSLWRLSGTGVGHANEPGT